MMQAPPPEHVHASQAWVAVLARLPLLRRLKLTWTCKRDAMLAAEEWRWIMAELRGMRGLVSLRLWPCSDKDLLLQPQIKLLSSLRVC